MTTKNLKGLQEILDAADEANAEIENLATARAKEILEDQRKAEKKKTDADRRAAIAARARQLKFDDDSAERDEEAGQMKFILDPTPAPEPEPEPDPEPQAPVEPAPAPAPVDHDATGNPPTAVVPVVMPAPEPTPPRNNVDPRNWRGIAWLLAIMGAVIGLIVARVTYGPMWSNVNSDTWHTVLVVLWFVALTAAGFFSGGWFGATREEKRNNPPAA
ncbi:hypothetical protein BH09PAT4_BH09PAT4_01590 [soil metagenome]